MLLRILIVIILLCCCSYFFNTRHVVVVEKPQVLKPVWHDILTDDATFVEYTKVSDKTICDYGIKCPDIASIEKIKNGVITKHNGLVCDDKKQRHAFGYWFWKNKKMTPNDPVFELDRALSFVRIWEQHFQHAAMGSFPKAKFYCGWIQKNIDMKIVVMNEKQKQVIQNACQLHNSRFIIFKGGDFLVKELYVIHWLTSDNTDQGSELTLAASPENIITMPFNNKPSTIFYMKRSKALGKRYVENEVSVLRILTQIALDLNLEMKIFSGNVEELIDAAYIIGPHGGAIANLIYGNSQTKVIEFIPLTGLQSRPCYILLAKTLGMKYDYVEPIKFNFDNGGMIIDVDLLKAKIYDDEKLNK